MKKRLVIGISGASGAPLAVRLLRNLKALPEWESHLVITKGGELTISYECKESVEEVKALADVCYDIADVGAAIASGSFRTEGMIVIPCSMKTVAGIKSGFAENLLLRAADVSIKEQRRLVLLARESPLSRVHLDNLAYLASVPGVFVLPPVLSYYHKPETIADVENQIVGRVLDIYGIDMADLKRWQDEG